jgi:probable rRNA maturation factor
MSSTYLQPLKNALRQTARLYDVDMKAELSVVLCDDSFIQDLNLRYRQKDKPTDVLSFGLEDDVLLGDIVISVDTAARQADRAGWPLSSEIAMLGVHGLLHLLGYDDTDEDGALTMERETRRVLTVSEIALPPGDHPFFTECLNQ